MRLPCECSCFPCLLCNTGISAGLSQAPQPTRADSCRHAVRWREDKKQHEGITDSSSTSFAWPSFSERMWSTWAMGRQPSVLLMNSMSSRSTSRTTRIFALACSRGQIELLVHAKVASVLQSSCCIVCSKQKSVICNRSIARPWVCHHFEYWILLQGLTAC